ncbi:MAG: BaiN/RdsA family NAD(P)/FAD-dependent oxidoreductase [Planctomycetota bacterium]
MLNTDYDIAVIGAGAAGLAAAIFATEPVDGAPGGQAPRVALLDGAKKIGAKILVSGGGRCNVTHRVVNARDFNGPRNTVKKILAGFSQKRTVEWFERMGVQLKEEETGKLFPVTDSARTVLDALLRECEQCGVDILTDRRVSELQQEDGLFTLTHNHGRLTASRVVLATGGRSLPKTGSDGQGWALARRLGHTVTETHAALAPLTLDSAFFHAALSGLSHEAELTSYASGKQVDRRAGSLLWTHFGVSGPVVMDASRFWTTAQHEGLSPRLHANLLPGETFEDTDRWLIDEIARDGSRQIHKLLGKRLPKRLAAELLEFCDVPPDRKLGQLHRDVRRRIVHALTDLELPVVNHRGWNYAEVTAGGVPMTEVTTRTLESKPCPGLYLVGEMLDVDGRIGGFNFQWAWSTGHAAGKAARAAWESC